MIRVSSLFVYPFLITFTVLTFGYAALGVNALPHLPEYLTLLAWVCVLPALLMSRRFNLGRSYVFFGLFLLYIIALAISTALTGNPEVLRLLAFLMDVFVDSKIYVLAFVLIAFVPSSKLEQLFGIILRMLFFVGLLNATFVLHDMVSTTSIHGFYLENRFGMNVPLGLFDHKSKSAQFQLMAMIAGLSMLIGDDRRRVFLWLAIGLLSFTVTVHMSVKELTSALIILFLYVTSRRHYDIGTATAVTVAALFAFTILAMIDSPIRVSFVDRMDVFFGETGAKTVRTAAYIGSVQLAADHFPFGTGAATFMSKGARDLAYSPFYFQTGIAYLYGGGPDDPQYIMDSFWPKIIGQSGLLGLVGYLGATIAMIVWSLRRYFALRSGRTFAAAMLILSIFIFSIATPSYTHDHIGMPVALAFAVTLSRGSLNTKRLRDRPRPFSVPVRPDVAVGVDGGMPRSW